MPKKNNGSEGRSPEDTRVVTNFEMLQKIREQGEIPTIRVSSFPLLSKALDGYAEGELIVVTGPTGCGKTLLCQTFTKDLVAKEGRPLWFSYEMPAKFFLRKFARESEDLQFYLPEELEAYSIEWVEGIIRKAKEKFETNFVFIDHLHYVFDIASSRNSSLDIGVIMRILKRLAVELEITIFIICHTTKSRIVEVEEIGLHTIRDSSLIAQEADSVIFVYRTEEDTGTCVESEAIVKVCKARRTGVMNKVIPIVKDGFYLREVDV